MQEQRVTLRIATSEDKLFLGGLYFDSRRQEVAAFGWPPAQQEFFLRMQFDAQFRSYQAAFPAATDNIICLDGDPIGRILVDRNSKALHLIDIAILENHRGQGIGTTLIGHLLLECRSQGLPMHLQVLQANPALRLYQRLGFTQTTADPIYIQMLYTPQSSERI
jgi:ribosomal protein S18 acetylase RimI-like enzyme